MASGDLLRSACASFLDIVFWKPSPPVAVLEWREITVGGEAFTAHVPTGQLTENLTLRHYISEFNRRYAEAVSQYAAAPERTNSPVEFLWSFGADASEAVARCLADFHLVLRSLADHEADSPLTQEEAHAAIRESLKAWHGFAPQEHEQQKIRQLVGVLLGPTPSKPSEDIKDQQIAIALEVWQRGGTWAESHKASGRPGDIKGTTRAVERFAKKNRITLRRGKPGWKRPRE